MSPYHRNVRELVGLNISKVRIQIDKMRRRIFFILNQKYSLLELIKIFVSICIQIKLMRLAPKPKQPTEKCTKESHCEYIPPPLVLDPQMGVKKVTKYIIFKKTTKKKQQRKSSFHLGASRWQFLMIFFEAAIWTIILITVIQLFNLFIKRVLN